MRTYLIMLTRLDGKWIHDHPFHPRWVGKGNREIESKQEGGEYGGAGWRG